MISFSLHWYLTLVPIAFILMIAFLSCGDRGEIGTFAACSLAWPIALAVIIIICIYTMIEYLRQWWINRGSNYKSIITNEDDADVRQTDY